MSAKNDALFLLIKSLTKNEKGYFKKIARKNASEKETLNYVKLFDVLDEMESNNEGFLKKDFLFRYLHRLKHYLYSNLLLALNSYHSNNSVEIGIRRDINSIAIIYEKALFNQCVKVLEKAKKTAYEYEKFSLLIDLIQWEIKILWARVEIKVILKIADSLVKESNFISQKIENLSQYNILYLQIFALVRSEGSIRNASQQKKYDQIIYSPLMKSEKCAISNYARMFFYHIYALYYFACQDTQNTYLVLKKLIFHIESSPALLKEESEKYFIFVNNLLEVCIEAGHFSEVPGLIHKVSSIIGNTKASGSVNVVARGVARCYTNELYYYSSIGVFERGVSKMEEIKGQLNVYGGKMNIANKVELYYAMAYSYFGVSDYKNAIVWLNKILQDREAIPIREFYSYASFLNMIIHFEKQNMDYLQSLMKQIYIDLESQKQRFRIETVMLNFFSDFIDRPSIAESKRILLYKKYLLKINLLIEFPSEKRMLQRINIITWLESKIKKESFAKTVREKAGLKVN